MHCGTSVIIPVHNGAAYIAAAMRSALDQLDSTDELIVVNDGSTDNTLVQIANVADARVRLVQSPRRGVSAARNFGFQAARGEFIAFLDHDDLWPPGRHEHLIGA